MVERIPTKLGAGSPIGLEQVRPVFHQVPQRFSFRKLGLWNDKINRQPTLGSIIPAPNSRNALAQPTEPHYLRQEYKVE